MQPRNPSEPASEIDRLHPSGDGVTGNDGHSHLDGRAYQHDGQAGCENLPAAVDERREELRPDLEQECIAKHHAPGKDFHIVGVGASAGGLEALESFFDGMPADSGMAFVVVQHLSPDFKSVMDELLARRTRIPIHRVEDGMMVEPNAIYLIPPKKEMIISDGKLLLSDKDPGQGLTLPIDMFFRSLAQDAGSRAVGVILSGTGSDGSRGIADIHEAGGFVLAQDLESSKFDGMPKSAAETGIVDLVLTPDRMHAALASYAKQPGTGDLGEFLPSDPALLEGFDAIFQLLRKNHGIDFSYYKCSTVTRRVQRRLMMSQITDLDDYVERLRDDPEELNRLYKDLLIGVTKFFRDAEAFACLERDVLPQLLTKLRPEEELRIWVAGCATGEEAYSIAILAREQFEKLERPVNVKIFATDVHRVSLDTASAGIYEEASLSEVSEQRLERWFQRVNSGYQVAQDLRQMIVFAPHNIIKDAPFTKMHLITCRNLLIYLEPPAQKKAVSLFHFALNTGGVMMMGPSESPGEVADEFAPIDDRWKVYRKRRDKRLPADMRLPLSAGYTNPRGPIASAHAPAPMDPPATRAYEELIREFAPPSLLINERRELVQSFSGGADFLRMRDGRASSDVLNLILPDLKVPLTSALQKLSKKQSPVIYKGIRVARETGRQRVKLTAKALPDRGGEHGHVLVSFEPQTDIVPPSSERDGDEMDLSQASKDHVLALEQELRYAKENLQATIEEMETSNEELQATNEELVASNEELQSTNEELHSVNEELYTVNAEYQKKIGELTEMTADMDNLLHATEVGVIFLGPDLCIRKFTPKIAETFHLMPLDVGRRIDSFAHTIERADLVEDIKHVLREQKPWETDVRAKSGRIFLLRILPYRVESRMEGVLLVLIDITQLKRTQQENQWMSKVFRDGADPIVIKNLDGHIIDVNAEAERSYGWSRKELIGQNIEILLPHQERSRHREFRERCLEKRQVRNVESVIQCQKGNPIPVLLTLSLITGERNEPVAIVTIAKDITDHKRSEEIAREAVRKRDQFLAMLSHELRNPLGAVLNATYLLDRAPESELPGPLAGACNVIQRQTLQIARLLDDLLDVSRVTQGKIEIRHQIVDMTKLVEDAVQAARPLIDPHGHEFHIDVAPGPLHVEGDPSRLLQIQENLLTNAAKYTPPGGRIDFSLAQEDGEAVIRVRDNGRGIPAQLLESIFELFVQSDDTLDRADGGMGLGLTLVNMLVKLHNGRVSAHSDGPGQGSEFVVRLPLCADPTPEHPREDSSTPTANQVRHVVIVEDNDDSREMLEALLKLKGCEVTTARDGKEGLEVILRQRPDVAIVDIGLPQMSGYAIARQIRQEGGNSSIRLIALTGYGRSEDRKSVQQAGFDAHLVKPLNPDDLFALLTDGS